MSSPNLDNQSTKPSITFFGIIKNTALVSVTFIVNAIALVAASYSLDLLGNNFNLTSKDIFTTIGTLGSILTILNIGAISIMLERQTTKVSEAMSDSKAKIAVLELLPDKVNKTYAVLNEGDDSVVTPLKSIRTSVSGLETSVNGRLDSLEDAVSGEGGVITILMQILQNTSKENN